MTDEEIVKEMQRAWGRAADDILAPGEEMPGEDVACIALDIAPYEVQKAWLIRDDETRERIKRKAFNYEAWYC
jgi:hypothetical protein